MIRTARVVFGVTLMLSMAFSSFGEAQSSASRNDRFALFVMTNSAVKNEVISFTPGTDGQLHKFRAFATGGRGSGGVTDPLESQGSLTLSEDRELLFAVNAGSGELTVFRVQGPELARLDVVPSGGSNPTAVAQRGNLVFVLNAGGGSNVTVFALQPNGKLRQIDGAKSFLSSNNPRAGSLAISPDRRFLLVTEKATNQLDAFPINPNGTLGPAVRTPSAGPGLFAVVFAPNGLAITSETGPGTPGNTSAVSSYALAPNGTLVPISVSIPTAGAATCWQVVTPNGKFLYTANSATSTISGFRIGLNGTLDPLPGTVLANLSQGAVDLDVAVSSDGRFLYSLNSGSGTVGVFQINQDGTLNELGELEGLTATAGFNGIAAR
ncbi:MAG: beta-propeller fold lactonase family protein [Terriglobia bacterium]|nr:beta-propeller fold lactonase family protein [Terriglobia bacterium]